MLAEVQWTAWQIIIMASIVIAAIVVYDKGWPTFRK